MADRSLEELNKVYQMNFRTTVYSLIAIEIVSLFVLSFRTYPAVWETMYRPADPKAQYRQALEKSVLQIQRTAPQPFTEYMTLTGARLEGDRIVFSVQLSATLGGVNEHYMYHFLTQAVCNDHVRELMQNGFIFQYDFRQALPASQAAGRVILDRCG